VITTDRGLCGGLNTNLLRATVLHMKEQHEQGKAIEIAAVGNKAVGFFRRQGGEVKYVVNSFGELADPTVLHGPVAGLVNDFERGELDTIYICCNNFVNTMTQRPEVSPLVPVSAVDGEGAAERRIGEYIWDYIYEPDAETVLNLIIRRYIDSRVYRSVVENIACEMAARMVAMKAASDNAGELIDELQLAYNKARQAAITQEIAEIVGGAAAV
jgi:F-type H+-transporting ATPase subunit gamma